MSDEPQMEVLTIDQKVERYIKLRDRLKEADDAHKAKTKPAREYLETLEGLMLQELQAMGAEKVGTPAGTVYRTVKKSATIADGAAFRSFVIGGELWDLVDWKANVTATAEFIEQNDAPPPGINYSTRLEVGVRRK